MGARVQQRSNKVNSVGEGNLVTGGDGCLARQGMDRERGGGLFKKKKGLCFYCHIYGSIQICVGRICKLSAAWALAGWYYWWS